MESNLDPSSLLSYYQILMHAGMNHVHSSLEVKQSQLSQPCLLRKVLQSLNNLCSPSLDPLKCVCIFSILGKPQLGITLQICLSSANRGRTASLDQLMMLLKYSPGCCWHLLQGCIAGSWLILCSMELKPFPKKLLSSYLALQPGGWHYTFPPAGLSISIC